MTGDAGLIPNLTKRSDKLSPFFAAGSLAQPPRFFPIAAPQGALPLVTQA